MAVVVSIEQLRKYREHKKNVVKNFLVSYFKDKYESSGEIELPYFIKANNVYNEIIKNNKDLNKYYNKILKRSC